MLKHQRPKQSVFTPKIDRILPLRVLSEQMNKYQRKFLVAYIDLCKAFNSVDRDYLSQLLCFHGIPDALINLLSALYTGTKSAVRCVSSLQLFPGRYWAGLVKVG